MRWPPAGKEVRPWAGGNVTGMELWVVGDIPWPHGAARVDGRVLEGRPAFDLARKRAGDDPTLLAGLAMLFLDDGAAGQDPWTAPVANDRVPDQQAIAEPPRLTGDDLTWWRFHHQTVDLFRCSVKLSGGEVTCVLGSEVLRSRRVAADPLAAARGDLATDNLYIRQRAIPLLQGSGTPEAGALLLELLLTDADWQIRQAAATAVGSVKPAGAAEALSRSLLMDGYAAVRASAATAMGTLGDAAVVAALDKAVAGDKDPMVRAEATTARAKYR